MTAPRGAARSERHRVMGVAGQSTVELALVLPFALLVLLALVQVGVVVHDQVMVTHAAREAARAAAVRPDPDAARTAAGRAGGLDPERLQVAMQRRDTTPPTVEVHVDYVCVTDLPLVGRLVPDVTLRADATMQVEQP